MPSILDFFLGTSSRIIVDALELELKVESDHSDGEDKEQTENSRRKKNNFVLCGVENVMWLRVLHCCCIAKVNYINSTLYSKCIIL